MKWLTLDYIHEHSRLDYNCEDAAIEQYATAAEDTVLAVIRRTLKNVIDKYGEIPAALFEGALMLTDLGYTHRSPVTTQNLSVIPYTFDFIIANYMRLDKATDLQAERDQLLTMLADVKTELDFNYEDIETPSAEQIAGYETISGTIESVAERYTNIENPTAAICAKLRTKLEAIKTEAEALVAE